MANPAQSKGPVEDGADHNLFSILARSSAGREGQSFLVPGSGPTLSYADMLEGTARVSAWLLASGVGAGDRVVAQVGKSAAAILLYLGCLRAGAVFVPLNTAYQAAEVAYFLARCRTHPARRRSWNGQRRRCLRWDARHLGRGPDADAVGQRPSPGGRGHGRPRRPGRDPLHLRHDGTVQGSGHHPPQPVLQRHRAARGLGLARGRRPPACAAGVSRAWPLRRAPRRDAERRRPILFHDRFEAAAVIQDLPRSTVFMGVPTYYTRLLAKPGPRRGRLPRHAALRQRIGAAPGSDVPRIRAAHRTRHPRTLRHDRGADDHVQPVRRQAHRRNRRPALAGRLASGSSARTGRWPPRRRRRPPVEGPQPVRRLLAQPGEDGRGAYAPTATS